MRKLLRFLPDSVYISLVYFKHFGRFPNLKNPKTYNEKLQWLKLHDRREEYTLMVDKHLVKQYVADKVGEQHIIPTLGVWERAEDIDFDALPEKFVLKWNHDSGSVVICKDKSGFDRAAAVAHLKKFEDHNGFWYGREWPYKNVKPCIIAEQFVEDVDELIEYKLFCFDGKVKMILSRKGNPVSGKYTNDYCDTELKRLPFSALHPNSEGEVYVPKQLPELIAFAETLSAGLRHVRVDTYIADEQIYFGELTFFNNSGFCPFEPSEWDEIVGQWLVLPQKRKGVGIMLIPNVELNGKTVLVTGAAGFIGSNLVLELLRTVPGIKLIGLDSVNDYYDVSIKEYRLQEIEKEAAKHPDCSWSFVKGNLADRSLIERLFEENGFSVAVNLAAQAGVRYSITNPDAYIEANIIGFYNILEACRRYPVEHLVYASSSSVYGSNKKVPYSTDDKVDNPVSLYAATKKSNELMAHAYSKLYNIPSTGLRFFTVYGPAGRPDMAYFGFTNKLRKGETIEIFNYGNCQRDFTYVDDIVTGIRCVMCNAPEKQLGEDGLPLPPYRVYNIGNNSPENLLDFVTILQEELIRAQVLDKDYDFNSHKKLVPMQPGDVPITYADTSLLERDFGFKPATPLREGLRCFAEWYKEFYDV